MSREGRIWLAVNIAFILAILVFLLVGARRCQRRGGQYVRGLFWIQR